MTTKILFHSYGDRHCPDGFASAWVAHKFFGNAADFHPVEYKKTASDYEGLIAALHLTKNDIVYMLDWSIQYPYIIQKLQRTVKELHILDHHKTALESLLGLSPNFLLDSSRSGAMISWHHFFPNEPVPALIRYVMDRDIWQKKLPHTEEMHLALGRMEQTFSTYDYLGGLSDEEYIEALLPLGRSLMKEREKCIEKELLRASFADLDEHPIGLIENLESSLVSDALNRLCLEHPEIDFAMSYRRKGNEFKVELRSTKNVDVSAIAKKYGGGGHYHAAGFIVSDDDFQFL
jgi:oligoribonuclease NrnB/cAMP/cGMP phosphodiesterase (DHH superfamily)